MLAHRGVLVLHRERILSFFRAKGLLTGVLRGLLTIRVQHPELLLFRRQVDCEVYKSVQGPII